MAEKTAVHIGFVIFCTAALHGDTSFITTQYTVRITQKEHLLIWNSETTQNLNIYLYNYQTETAIFLATKHEKTIMACSYLNF